MSGCQWCVGARGGSRALTGSSSHSCRLYQDCNPLAATHHRRFPALFPVVRSPGKEPKGSRTAWHRPRESAITHGAGAIRPSLRFTDGARPESAKPATTWAPLQAQGAAH